MFKQRTSRYFNLFLAGAIIMVAVYAMMFEVTKYPNNWKFSYSIVTVEILNAGLIFSVYKNNWMITKAAAEFGTLLPGIAFLITVIEVLAKVDPKFIFFVAIVIGIVELFLVSPDK